MRSFKTRLSVLAIVAATASGCQIHAPNFTEDDDGTIDARANDGTDARDCIASDLSFELMNIAPCDVPESTGNFVFPTGNVTIDTTAGTVTDAAGDVTGIAHSIAAQLGGAAEAMVLAADDLTIADGTVVRVTGNRPLVLVAFGTLTIQGTLDATGDRGLGGPGADLTCSAGAGELGPVHIAGNGRNGGAGGSGGGYGTDGGDGAEVNPEPTITTPAFTPGGTSWPHDLTPIVGGCTGGEGGAPDQQTRARAGGGGGGIQLAAGTGLIVTAGGIVSVSGAGGEGATSLEAGGGGGGSGGSILLQTVDLTVAGFVTANGGAGGEGRRDTQAGGNGADGSLDTDTPALADGGAAGGDGGNGAAATTPATDGVVGLGNASGTAGGGGGGAGVGRIHFDAVNSTLVGGVVSPPAS